MVNMARNTPAYLQFVKVKRVLNAVTGTLCILYLVICIPLYLYLPSDYGQDYTAILYGPLIAVCVISFICHGVIVYYKRIAIRQISLAADQVQSVSVANNPPPPPPGLEAYQHQQGGQPHAFYAVPHGQQFNNGGTNMASNEQQQDAPAPFQYNPMMPPVQPSEPGWVMPMPAPAAEIHGSREQPTH